MIFRQGFPRFLAFSRIFGEIKSKIKIESLCRNFLGLEEFGKKVSIDSAIFREVLEKRMADEKSNSTSITRKQDDFRTEF